MIDAPNHPSREIDYATPRDSRPRPGVAMWAAAGFVWATCLPLAAASAVGFRLALARAIYEAIPVAIILGAVPAGVAAIEWLAVVRRSRVCAVAICYVAGAYGSLVASWIANLAGAVPLGTAVARQRRGVVSGILFECAVVLVVVAHVRWAIALKRHARDAAAAEEER